MSSDPVQALIDALEAGGDWVPLLAALQSDLPGATWAPGDEFANDVSQLRMSLRGVCELLETQRVGPDEGAALLRALSRPGPAARDFELDDDRWRTGDLLGVGGMGEVRTVHDRRLGRSIAQKWLLAPNPDTALVERFVREAQHRTAPNTPTSFRSTT
ncbi:MAG: hypothetical protein GY913_29530 [Proteobacteria bacterium]|nr:hypothetical protein [Pseudomonadota bacterium]MCP4921057.1 hypothetical protein [Pseudomonadota bacterium]